MIVGGGFGGLYAARGTSQSSRSGDAARSPQSPRVSASAVPGGDGGALARRHRVPIRWILRRQKNVDVLLAEVVRVDPARHVLILTDGEMSYDFLILATGATHAYFGHDDWRVTAPGLKSLEDALEVRRRVLMAYERAERETDERSAPRCSRLW